MSNQGKLLPPGTVSDTANRNFSGAIVISENGGSLATHGPLTIGGPCTVGGVSLGGLTSQQTPASWGLLAYNFSPQFATGTGGAVTTGGKLYLAQLPLPGGTAITNLWFSIATAAATPTASENFAGLVNAAGQVVASTADLSTAIGTNTGFIKCPLSAAYQTPANPGPLWVVLLLNAGTLPVLTTYVGQTAATTSAANFGSVTTFGNTAANYPYALAASSANTVLPSQITMSTNTATGSYVFWAGAN